MLRLGLCLTQPEDGCPATPSNERPKTEEKLLEHAFKLAATKYITPHTALLTKTV